MSWIVLFALLSLAAIYVSTPLFAPATIVEDDKARELSALREQLIEVNTQREQGLLTDEAARIAALPLERRVLELLDSKSTSKPLQAKALSYLIPLFMAAGAFGLYAMLGQPGFERSAIRQANLAPIDLSQMSTEEIVAQLSEKLSEDPDPPARGYQLLGRLLMTLERTEEAIVAYQQAVDISEGDPNIVSEFEAAKRLIVSRDSDLDPSLGFAGQANSMSPDQRAAFVQSMVDGLSSRLASSPEDIEGWARLLRARQVLGQEDIAVLEIEQGLLSLKSNDALRDQLIELSEQFGYDIPE